MLYVHNLPFQNDPKNMVIDWILITLFGGSDYVVGIIDGFKDTSFDNIIKIWKGQLNIMGGYMADYQGNISLERFQIIIDEILKNRVQIKGVGNKVYNREEYYNKNFHIPNSDPDSMDMIAQNYFQGLNWVLKSYISDCPSWTWFSPYKKPPFLKDLLKLEESQLDFELGEPQTPLEGLAYVLRPESKELLPNNLQILVASKKSPAMKFPNGVVENPTPGFFCRYFYLKLYKYLFLSFFRLSASPTV